MHLAIADDVVTFTLGGVVKGMLLENVNEGSVGVDVDGIDHALAFFFLLDAQRKEVPDIGRQGDITFHDIVLSTEA